MVTDMKKRCWKGYAPVKGKKPYSKGSCRKVRRNPARQPDEAIARELYLFIENDEILLTRRYPQYILNLERKMKRGVYDREKAVKLFMYLADEASKRYSKQFGDGKTHTADVPTRMLLAKMLRDRFESERRAMGIPAGAMPRMNPAARTKTWKLGEYGGNIKALVNQSGNAVKIMADGGENGEYEERLFRWPMDKFNMEMYLNDLTTSYYASKVIEWVDGVTKGTSMNGRKADKIADKTKGVDVFVFMKNEFAGTEAEDKIERIARKFKGRDIGGGTDMRTGLREQQFYFRIRGNAVRFIREVEKLKVTKGYRAYVDDDDHNSKRVKLNPVPAGYHTMPDGRVMADSEHSVSTNPRGIDPNLEYKKEYGWTFVEFLKKRLIPDLRESGMYATIADYQRGISLYNDKKGVLPSTQYLNYLKYLRETLIPDLKESGSDSTAADFERMYKMVLYTWNNQPKIRKTKYRRDLDDR
jgi:hypothetical protein